MGRNEKVGVYIDAANVSLHGGFGLRYDILRKFACRGGEYPARLNVYQVIDAGRAENDSSYRQKVTRFAEVLRDYEYKVIEKPILHKGEDRNGDTLIRSAVDVDMAVDIIQHSRELDKVILVTSKSSFTKVIRVAQQNGCRVEVIGFDRLSTGLKKESDLYISGYLIPGLLPIESPYEWGKPGSRIRGVCYDFSHDDGYGFLRYLDSINEHLWITDSRFEDSPYKTVFAHISQFEDNFDTGYLPSRELIFEFDLVENDKGLVAENIVLVSAP